MQLYPYRIAASTGHRRFIFNILIISCQCHYLPLSLSLSHLPSASSRGKNWKPTPISPKFLPCLGLGLGLSLDPVETNNYPLGRIHQYQKKKKKKIDQSHKKKFTTQLTTHSNRKPPATQQQQRQPYKKIRIHPIHLDPIRSLPPVPHYIPLRPYIHIIYTTTKSALFPLPSSLYQTETSTENDNVNRLNQRRPRILSGFTSIVFGYRSLKSSYNRSIIYIQIQLQIESSTSTIIIDDESKSQSQCAK